MATEKLKKTGNDLTVIATDTTKPTNAALKAQGWEVTTDDVTQPSSGAAV